jgi:hypothetical protein
VSDQTPDHLPPEDRWFEDPAGPSPAYLRDLPPYPSVPAYADDVTDQESPFVPYLLLILAAVGGGVALAVWLTEGR